jgi:hypothetical protein
MAFADLFRPRQVPPAAAPAKRVARYGRLSPRSIVAAGGGMVPAGDPANRPPREKWQDETWRYYDGVGEFHYSATFLGACWARVTLTLGLLGDDDEPGPLFDDEGVPVDGVRPATAELARILLRMLRPATGGQSALLLPAGVNIASVGEFWLLGIDEKGPDGTTIVDRSFEVLSRDEIVPNAAGSGWARRRTPSAQPEPIDPDAFLLRVHRPHPRFGLYADAPSKALAPVLERMRLLTLAGQAEALSRLAGNGVWLVPEEVEWDDDDDGVDDSSHPLQRRLIEAMSTPIADPGSAGAFAPYVVEMPGEYIEKMTKYQRFDRPEWDVDAKRTAAVQEYARGVDLPVETVTGIGAANHWSAWAIDESVYKAHVEPPLTLVLDQFSARYLRAQLVAAGVDPAEARRIVIVPDAAGLVLHPNQETAAQDGYGTAVAPNFLVSASAWRRLRGIPEGDAPDDEEIAARVALAQELRPVQSGRGSGAAPTSAPPVAAPPVPAADAPAAGGLPPSTTAAGVAIAVEAAAERAADRAASKARDRARRAGHDLTGLPARAVVASLAARGVAWTIEPDDLPPGEFDALAAVVERHTGNREAALAAVQSATVAALRLAAEPR